MEQSNNSTVNGLDLSYQTYGNEQTFPGEVYEMKVK